MTPRLQSDGKLIKMRRGQTYSPKYPSYAVFEPKRDFPSKRNEKECGNLSRFKTLYCKEEELTKCIINTPDDELKINHDRMMLCRNIRAIENKANCRYEKGWLTNNDPGHATQIAEKGNAAYNCLEEFYRRKFRRKSKSKSAAIKQKSKSKPVPRRQKSKSVKGRRPKRKFNRKRTPSRKMK